MTTRRAETFGDLLRCHRQEAGLTQEALAERAQLSARAISELERGTRQYPYRSTIQLLAAALRLGPEQLAAFAQAAQRPPPPRATRARAPTAAGSVASDAGPPRVLGRLTVLFLGPPRIQRDGIEVVPDTRKAVALLAYLAITRQRHARDTLAALLWPEYSDTNARTALRRTLSALNHALPMGYLAIARDSIELNRDAGIDLDVDRFYACLAECRTHGHPLHTVCPDCREPLTRAVTLYRDDFLAGFALRDSAAFDEWQLMQAAALRRELARALEKLVQVQSGLGDFDAAGAATQRWLAIDPLHEPAHRHLMLLFAWSGQRTAAVQQYRACVQVLEQDLGVAPLEETTRLYEAIRENRIPRPPTLPDNGRPGHVDEPSSVHMDPVDDTTNAPPHPPVREHAVMPLVARSAEWQALLEAYNAIPERGCVIVLQGEAGIGKTRLAEEFLAHTRAGGAVTLAARAYEGEQNLAYGPVVSVLRAALEQPDSDAHLGQIPDVWLREGAKLIPDLGLPGNTPPQPRAAHDEAAQSRFFEGIRRVLLVLSGGRAPGVLFFDDLQWADGATIEFLTYFARRLERTPVCLLLAWRTEHQPEGGRCDAILAGARVAAEGVVVPLGRLSRDAVAELVDWAAVAPPVERSALAARLYEETEGLPLFLREYLDALASGSYTSGVDPWPLLGGMRELLHSRLRGLSETGWQLLTSAAVIGRSFGFDTVRDASGRTEDEAVAALEELIAAGLIGEVRGSLTPGEAPAYDFTHDKLRALVYAETSLGRRRLLHHRVAAALQSQARGPRRIEPLAGQIAYHYHNAGNEELAADYYKLAGERARSLYANHEALAHLQTALALGHLETTELHIAVGDLHTLLGSYRAAINSYETAAGLAANGQVAEIEHRLGLVYQRRGQWELAEAHLAAALDAHTQAGEMAGSARVYTDWSLTALQQGSTERAYHLAEHALDLAVSSEDRRALARAHNVLGIITSKRGDPAGARNHLEQSLALAEALGDIEVRAAVLNNLALAHGAAGEIDRALSLAGAALDLCIARGDRHREAAIHNNIADLLHQEGRAAEAMTHLKQAVGILGEIGAEAGDLQPAIWMLSEW